MEKYRKCIPRMQASYIIKNPIGSKTMKMRMNKIIGGFFCICLLLFQLPLQTAAANAANGPSPPPEESSLFATASVLMDADSGRVLYGKNEDAVMAMASTTKIMTCIVVLENASLDETLTVSAYAASMPKVKLYIQKGEQYTIRDLLHSLMLESHNDTAVALAEHIGRQHLPPELQDKAVTEYTAEESKQAVSAFAALMNDKAAELGCKNTWFITPNGLDATETISLSDGSTIQKEHCTTARELAGILSYCIKESPKRQEFLDITRTQNYSFSANGRSFSCVNHNAFLTMMDGALTGKTGFTNKAGYCYVGALTRDDRTFIVVLLACGWPNNKGYKWTDTRKLMQYGIDNYFYRSFSGTDVAFDESILSPLPVQNGQTVVLNATAYTDVEIVRDMPPGGQTSDTEKENGSSGNGDSQWLEGLLLRPDEKIYVRYSVKEKLTAPVERGTVVGSIDYIVDDVVYKRESVVAKESVEAIDLKWCAKQVWKRFLCIR